MQKDLLQLLDENKLPELFLELGDLAPANATGKRLRQEYVSGTHRTDVDYLGRLRTYVQSLDLATLYQQRQSHTLLRCTAAVPEYFLGREKELAAIKTGLQRGNFKLMNGEGGIGKTTLAAKYWQDSRQDYSYRAWLFCESGILNNLLLRLAPALDLDLKGVPTEQQLELLAATIERLPGRFLLVLDNANDAEELRRFERFSRDLPWEVLVTTRCTRGFERMYQIESLPPEQARELFLTHCPPKGDGFDGLLDRFLQAVHYHTLCVEIFAKNLREGRRAGYHLAKLLKDLESEGLFLADRSFEIRTKYDGNVQREAATSDDLLRILYDFTTLTEAEIFLLIQLALLPAESHSLTVTGPLLRYPTQETVAGPRRLFGLLPGKMTTRTSYGQELPVLKRQLDALVADGWLFAEEEGYRMSPVVQKIVRQAHAERLWEMGEWMVERLREWFETKDGTPIKPLHDLESFVLLVDELLDIFGVRNESCASLTFSLGDYHSSTGQYAPAKMAYNALKQYVDVHQDEFWEYLYWSRIGNLFLAQGNLQDAKVSYQQYLNITQKLVKDNPNSVKLQRDLSVSYEKIGNLLQAEGKNQDARQQFQLALDIRQRLAQQNPKSEQLQRDLSVSYNKIADLLQAEGKNQDARQQFQLALDIRQRLAQQNPKSEQLQRDLSYSHYQIGQLLLREEQAEAALAYLEASLAIDKKLVAHNPKAVVLRQDVAASYKALFNYYTTHGTPEALATIQAEALAFYQELVARYPEVGELAGDPPPAPPS